MPLPGHPATWLLLAAMNASGHGEGGATGLISHLILRCRVEAVRVCLVGWDAVGAGASQASVWSAA